MDKNIDEQEFRCLRAKLLCDKLITNLFLIDDFKSSDLEFYYKQLMKIKSYVHKIYLEL